MTYEQAQPLLPTLFNGVVPTRRDDRGAPSTCSGHAAPPCLCYHKGDHFGRTVIYSLTRLTMFALGKAILHPRIGIITQALN